MLVTGQGYADGHEHILALQLGALLNLLEQCLHCCIIQIFYLRQLFQQHVNYGGHGLDLQNRFCFLVFKIKFIIEVHFYASGNLCCIGNMLLCSSHNALQPSQLLALFLAGHITSSNHMGLSSFKEGFSIQLTHIMLVNPVQLIDIENCRILSYAVHGELFNQLLHAEDFLLAIGSPAQQSQEIVDAGGQIAQLTILVHTGSAMALAHLGVVLAQNQGNMTKGGLLKAQCIINQALARSVGQMLLSTDYMGNVHQSIVDYYGIVIGGDAIGFNDNKITDIIGIKYYIATHHIAHQDLLISGHAEAHGRLATFSLKLSDLLGSQVAAFAHVARHFASLNQGLALLL